MASSIFASRCRALMAAAKSASAKSSEAVTTAKMKSSARANAITRIQTVSPALAKFLGSPEESRSGAVKKIWDYVKSHNLQNPVNKREIFCDDKLKTIFGGQDKVNFLEIAKLLSNHFPKAA